MKYMNPLSEVMEAKVAINELAKRVAENSFANTKDRGQILFAAIVGYQTIQALSQSHAEELSGFLEMNADLADIYKTARDTLLDSILEELTQLAPLFRNGKLPLPRGNKQTLTIPQESAFINGIDAVQSSGEEAHQERLRGVFTLAGGLQSVQETVFEILASYSTLGGPGDGPRQFGDDAKSKSHIFVLASIVGIPREILMNTTFAKIPELIAAKKLELFGAPMAAPQNVRF